MPFHAQAQHPCRLKRTSVRALLRALQQLALGGRNGFSAGGSSSAAVGRGGLPCSCTVQQGHHEQDASASRATHWTQAPGGSLGGRLGRLCLVLTPGRC